ncbi:ElaA protein [Stackebrandtia albiflava]|uniref:ElaA protein n=1 Tax=Stackebrandtia albiflava TaxID=406432 RepID=A0A562VBI8_9ACTN|nr:GNAT family N-acetyltransferase [Stackebrandtia albiflava]TWJ15239.1 ElaA protein [Stackebrandtia albiflava]
MDAVVVRRFAELDAATLYTLLRLRVAVFVVEQECPYQELDGRDTDPETRHLWIARDGGVAAYLRLLSDREGGYRIGRVCSASDARGEGLADRLMREAVRLTGPAPVRLEAQSYALGFYSRYGFLPDGPEYLEDGIPHTPMLRP